MSAGWEMRSPLREREWPGAAMWKTLGQLVHCTAPFNYLGLPAISVPGAPARNGLRSGVQLVGRPFAEGMLLRVAAAHERAGAG